MKLIHNVCLEITLLKWLLHLTGSSEWGRSQGRKVKFVMLLGVYCLVKPNIPGPLILDLIHHFVWHISCSILVLFYCAFNFQSCRHIMGTNFVITIPADVLSHQQTLHWLYDRQSFFLCFCGCWLYEFAFSDHKWLLYFTKKILDRVFYENSLVFVELWFMEIFSFEQQITEISLK